MVMSPAFARELTPDSALAAAEAVAAGVSDAVLLLRVSAPRGGQIERQWPALVWFNEAAAERFGLSRGDVEHIRWFDGPFAKNGELWSSLLNILRDDMTARAEVPFVTGDARTVRLDLTVTPLPGVGDAGGRFWTLVARNAVGSDMSPHATQARRLEALGLVAGSIAHDFANLVHVISGYTELAMREQSPQAAREAMQVVHDTAARAASLARQLLHFSRRQPLPPHPVPLRALVQGLLPMLERLAGKRVALHWSVSEERGLAQVWGHASQFEQVLLNLVVNAREAQPDGGVIHIGIDVLPMVDVHPPPAMASRPSKVVRLCVDDEGPGISPTLRDRVFEPFFTTKPAGTGLGLSTVFDIVRQAGGEVRFGDARPRAPEGVRGFRVELLLPQYAGD
jgi:signal transduction histidine kinase